MDGRITQNHRLELRVAVLLEMKTKLFLIPVMPWNGVLVEKIAIYKKKK